eukprot:3960916-Prymnesium_polylepis.1
MNAISDTSARHIREGGYKIKVCGCHHHHTHTHTVLAGLIRSPRRAPVTVHGRRTAPANASVPKHTLFSAVPSVTSISRPSPFLPSPEQQPTKS